MTIAELDVLIRAVCPIIGINSDGKIWFSLEATEEERAAAQEIMDLNFNNII